MKQMKFNEWFEMQYGGLPDSGLLLELDAKFHSLRREAAEVERRRDRLMFLSQCYTAALYSRQAFAKKPKWARGGMR